MLLPSLVGCAFLFGFALGKFSPHRWGVTKLKPHTFESSVGWACTILIPESSSSKDALRLQREFVETYNLAKARGMIH
jgi:hypothetical protein